MSTSTQWLFPQKALYHTPSRRELFPELMDRARGVEFIYRLGASLALPTPAMLTAATWFHRFYMRFSMEDFHRQDVAAAAVFLATKTEECGRKLRDVAKTCYIKTSGAELNDIPQECPEIDQCQSMILFAEEALMEALAFDFTVENVHAALAAYFLVCECDSNLEEFAWSIAHDSYRTPLCILFRVQVIACACVLLAQHVVDGPNSCSLRERLSTGHPRGSDHTTFNSIMTHFGLKHEESTSVEESLVILLDFYRNQVANGPYSYLSPILQIEPPKACNTVFSSGLSMDRNDLERITGTSPQPPHSDAQNSQITATANGEATPII